MATKAGLYKGAVGILKESAVGLTVSDDTRAVNEMNEHYDEVLGWALEQGLWNFATRTVAIDADSDEEPAFGFSYAIPKPDDYAGRFVAICGDAYFLNKLEGSQYHEEGGLDGFIFCNFNPLYVRYISNGNEYGLNLADWPWTFARAVQYELAFRVAPHITTLGEDAMLGLEKRKQRALRDARSKDALNQGAERPPAGRLARSRGGFSRRSWEG